MDGDIQVIVPIDSVITETAKAYLVKPYIVDEDVWVPKSLVNLSEDESKMTCPLWLVWKWDRSESKLEP